MFVKVDIELDKAQKEVCKLLGLSEYQYAKSYIDIRLAQYDYLRWHVDCSNERFEGCTNNGT